MEVPAMHWPAPVPLAEILRATTPAGPSFFGRPTVVVAREMIGCILIAGDCAGRIVETEAYLGLTDAASHAYPGPTPRNRVMFGPPGFTYVYFIYGMYHCLNFVTERDGVAGAVLVRALEPISGLEHMRQRRPKVHTWHDLAAGPGKLTLALGIGPEHSALPPGNGCIALRRPRIPAAPSQGIDRPLRWTPPPNAPIAVSPRIGIRKCADWPMRFLEHGNACVTKSPHNREARILAPTVD
jgi:DNA-3-methyladenine glycosylase